MTFLHWCGVELKSSQVLDWKETWRLATAVYRRHCGVGMVMACVVCSWLLRGNLYHAMYTMKALKCKTLVASDAFTVTYCVRVKISESIYCANSHAVTCSIVPCIVAMRSLSSTVAACSFIFTLQGCDQMCLSTICWCSLHLQNLPWIVEVSK